MADWHLQELDEALNAQGWRVITQHPGDDYNVSASWEVQRSTRFPSVFINFDGQNGVVRRPLEQAYACHIRVLPTVSLHFDAKNKKWNDGVRAFVEMLDYSEGQFTLVYDINHTGSSARARIYPGPKDEIWLTYIGPGLAGLAYAILEVMRTRESIRVTCSWLDEQGEIRWVLRRNGSQLVFRIWQFPDYSPNVEDEKGELFYEGECSLVRFAMQVRSQIERAERDFAGTNYQSRWSGEYPCNPLEELSQVVAEFREK